MSINTSQTVLKTERPQAPFLIFDIETVPDIPLLYMNYKEELKLDITFNEKIHWNDFSIYDAFKKQTKIICNFKSSERLKKDPEEFSHDLQKLATIKFVK